MRAQQQGVVLITVLVIVALIAIIATNGLAKLNVAARRTANLMDASSARYFVVGAEQLGIAALASFGKDKGKGEPTVHLGQPWARKGVVYPIEGGRLTGELEDLSACFNVNALLANKVLSRSPEDEGSPVRTGGIQLNQLTHTKLPGQRLLEILFEHILPADSPLTPQALAARIRDWIDPDSEPFGQDGAEDYVYMAMQPPYRTANAPMASITELRLIQGMTDKVYRAIAPYLCALPDKEMITINLNTIDENRPEFLLMLYSGLTEARAEEILRNRPKNGFDSDKFLQQLGNGVKVRPEAKDMPAFTSDRFLLKARAEVRRGRAYLESMIIRGKRGRFEVLLRRFAPEYETIERNLR